MSEVTRILSAMEYGDPHAASQLMPLLYDELSMRAAQRPIAYRPNKQLRSVLYQS